MNIQQLRYLCCVVDEGFSVSQAARTLGTSQPAVSQQVRALEKSVGVDLLIRRGNRITGLTTAGEAVLSTARRTLREADNFGRIAEDFKQRGSGRLIVATTHLSARYMLGPVIREFLRSNPGVQFGLRQGTPSQIAAWVAAGEADMGIGTPPFEMQDDLVYLRCTELPRIVIVPAGHKLLREPRLSLKILARHPFIVMDPTFTGGMIVANAFGAAALQPRVVLTAIDVDVIKWYVELGVGIAVLPSIAFDAQRDIGLRAIEAGHLFEPTVTHVELRRDTYMRSSMLNLITMIAPQWSREEIQRQMQAPPRSQ